MSRASINLRAPLFSVLLLVGISGCKLPPLQPIKIPRQSYKIFLIPLYQELGVPPRVDQIEEWACYVFTLSVLEIDVLFQSAKKKIPLEKTKPKVVRDPRVKLQQAGSHKVLVITSHLQVLSVDAMHVYQIESNVVMKAVAAILSAARSVKAKDDDCFSPEPPDGWYEGLPYGCL